MAIGKEVDDVLDLPLRPGEGSGSGAGSTRGARVSWWAERLWSTVEATTGLDLRGAGNDDDDDDVDGAEVGA
jgi:hypothetical protein